MNRQLSEGRTPTVRPFHAMSYEIDHRWLRTLTEVTFPLTHIFPHEMHLSPPTLRFLPSSE